MADYQIKYNLKNNKVKNLFKALFSFALFFVLTSALSVHLQNTAGLSPLVTFGGAIALAFVAAKYQRYSRLYTSGIEVEFWANYIMERFWKDNMFIKNSFSDDQYVVGGKIVHIPQPGSKPTVVKGRTTFPASTVRRTDTDILYSLNEYSTDPTHIQDAEKVEVSYSKIDSVLGDHAGVLNETIADDLLITWLGSLPKANIIETSGDTTAAKVPGQTGNRLAMVYGDLKKARLAMNLNNVPGTDRFALLEENMADEFTDSLSATQYKDFSQYYDARTGVIGRLFGFNIMTRSSVITAKDALSTTTELLQVNALGATIGATDDVVSLCWQKNAVTRALGEVKFFEDQNNPLYYGDIYSALIRMGGRRRRKDDLGVIAIKQMTPAI